MDARALVDLVRTHHGRKALRYSMVSVVAVVCTQSLIFLTHGVLGWGAGRANVTAVTLASIPSYLLNRRWVWGRVGAHDWLREVAPFWIMAFAGLCLSVVFVGAASRWSDTTVVVSLANMSAFAILWGVRYLVLDQMLFRALQHVHHEESVTEG